MQSDNDKPLLAEIREAELPRWIQVIVVIFVGVFALLCAFATVDMMLLAGIKSSPSRILAVVVVLILLLGCFWVLLKCYRLVAGRKKRGGLLSPTALRVVAVFLLIMPVGGLFTGYYREMGPLAIFQALMYVSGFFGLRALARKREASLTEKPKSEGTET
jgi:membrane-associated HD superfamily phosphohydrolase